MTHMKHSRRQFLRKIALLSAGAALTPNALAKNSIPESGRIIPLSDMSLSFNNLHTGEKLNATFFCNGKFVPDSMDAICYLLRDHRNDKVGDMSPELMVLLHDLQLKLGVDKPVEVISGYRSPETNAMLSQRSGKVAKKSLHMQGKAIDIRIPGVHLMDLHRAARQINRGGVGLYTRSKFVHLDTGRPRFWGS